MFGHTSRYHGQKLVDATCQGGRKVKALSLRRLPSVKGEPAIVKENDRLDVMAQRKFGNPAAFWHIADANTELEANDLTKTTGRTIRVPER